MYLLLKKNTERVAENLIYLHSPSNQSIIHSIDELTNVTFAWSFKEMVPENVRFEIAYDAQFKNKITYKDLQHGSGLTLALERGQDYYWHVIVRQANAISMSETNRFSIAVKEGQSSLASAPEHPISNKDNVGAIRWVQPGSDNIHYASVKPSIQLEWTQAPKVVNWELHYEKIVKEEKGQLSFSETTANIELPTEGLWQFEVVGTDAKGKVVASTQKMKVNLSPKLTLEAPYLIAPSSGNPVRVAVTASAEGYVNLKWNSVCSATSYDINLLCSNNPTDERNFSSQTPNYELNGLSCQKYKVKVRARDRMDQLSPYSRDYEIVLKSKAASNKSAAVSRDRVSHYLIALKNQ